MQAYESFHKTLQKQQYVLISTAMNQNRVCHKSAAITPFRTIPFGFSFFLCEIEKIEHFIRSILSDMRRCTCHWHKSVFPLIAHSFVKSEKMQTEFITRKKVRTCYSLLLLFKILWKYVEWEREHERASDSAREQERGRNCLYVRIFQLYDDTRANCFV